LAAQAKLLRIYLAPMEGLFDEIMRDLLTRVGGIDLCVAEFVRVSGTLLPRRTFQRIVPELKQGSRTRCGVPVRVQLLGSDPISMAWNAARLAELNPAGIDLNFGCPAKTVNRHQGGAILLREPERLHAVVAAVRGAVPLAVPVSAKMRLGYEDKSLAVDCAQAIAAGGACELVVHARTQREGYRPPAHWEWIARIRAGVKIPVIANGEIWTLEDWRHCQESSGAQDVMLGRGMAANPALARMLKEGAGAALAWREVLGLLREFWAYHGRHTAAPHRCGRVKQWLNYLRAAYPEAAVLYQALRTVAQPEALEQILLP
jgi:tRNA-dihydrouridine synthase C